MSSQPRKHCQCVNLNHADAKVIGSSLISIGPKLAQDIVKLHDCISTEQGCIWKLPTLPSLLKSVFQEIHGSKTSLIILFVSMIT